MSMSLKATLYVWECIRDVTPTEKLMMLAIADFADPQGNATPPVESLADHCGVTREYTRRLHRTLEEKGVLIVLQNGGVDTPNGRTNLYQIVGVKDWISPLREDTDPNYSRGVLLDDPNNSRGVPPDSCSPFTVSKQTLSSKTTSSLTSTRGKKTPTKPKKKTTPKPKMNPDDPKVLTDHQLVVGVVADLYRDNPACPNGMEMSLASSIAAGLRGKGRAQWRMKSLAAQPMNADEALGLKLYCSDNGITPSLSPDKLSQLVFSFRSSPRHDELIVEAKRAAARMAQQKPTDAPQLSGETVEMDVDQFLGLGE